MIDILEIIFSEETRVLLLEVIEKFKEIYSLKDLIVIYFGNIVIDTIIIKGIFLFFKLIKHTITRKKNLLRGIRY